MIQTLKEKKNNLAFLWLFENMEFFKYHTVPGISLVWTCLIATGVPDPDWSLNGFPSQYRHR
jgi:16S rRNA C1402 (ribose-2'-O) methylase RsmI